MLTFWFFSWLDFEFWGRDMGNTWSKWYWISAHKFLRRILNVKKSTNLTAIYGELGRVPLMVFRKVIMRKYWIKILNQNDSSLVKKLYTLLKSDTDVNNNYTGNNWAYQIKSMLQQHGLEFIWNQQFEIEMPFNIIKQRIFDIYYTLYQRWYSEINNSNRLMSYSIFKHDFVLEKYLNLIIENKYKVALSRFRTSSHDLFVETGRYDNVPRDQRVCKSCNMNRIEDEFRFVLVCPKYRELRKNTLKHISVTGQLYINLKTLCQRLQIKLYVTFLSLYIMPWKLEFHNTLGLNGGTLYIFCLVYHLLFCKQY